MQNHLNIFKNSGIRDKINQKLLEKENLKALGYALGAYLHETHSTSINILIGKDTRPSGTTIQHQLMQGLQKWKHTIFDTGIVPTPCIATALKKHTSPKFQLGIMITASHNPAEYNGLKIITPYGYLEVKEEEKISQYYFDYQQKLQTTHLKDKGNKCATPINLFFFYQQEIKKLILTKTFIKHKIILDCAHGATYSIAQQLFKSYGIETIMMNHSLNGHLINKESGNSNPKLLIQALQKHNADFACAFDGDGDRVIIVDKNYNIFDGDDLLLILKQHPLLQNETTLIGTILTNNGIEQQLTHQKQILIRTDVGERNLIQALIKHNALLATEPCGHITVLPHALCSDGIFAALLFLDTIQIHKKSLMKPYKHPQLHNTIALENGTIDDEAIRAITTEQSLIQEGRIIARKSNTEPVLRIMVEHKNIDTANVLLQDITQKLIKHIT